jgi:hypothetical protein
LVADDVVGKQRWTKAEGASMDLEPQPRKKFELDLDTYRAAFLGNLQKLLDHTRACEAGLACLKPEIYEAQLMRGGPIIHPPSELDFLAAMDFSRFWLMRAFFRDTVDFLQQYLEGCFWWPNLHQSMLSGQSEWWKRHVKAYRVFQKRGIQQKLDELRTEFRIDNPLGPHILSINRVRNCLVHRLGQVREEDCRGTGHLELRLQRLVTVGPGHGSGNWQRVQLKKGDLSFEDVITRWPPGQHVTIALEHLNDCLYTMMRFDDAMVEALAGYFKERGVTVTRALGDPRFNPGRSSAAKGP